MALGLGLAFVSKGEDESDSFGLIALCSVGPILSVMILGLVFQSSGGGYTPLSIPDVQTTRDLFMEFGRAIPHYGEEVLTALLPIVVLFLIFQFFFLKIRRRPLIKITIGMVYTFIGLTMFLTGVNVGFMSAGNELGGQISSLSYNWIIVPLAMLIGFYIIKKHYTWLSVFPAAIIFSANDKYITNSLAKSYLTIRLTDISRKDIM